MSEDLRRFALRLRLFSKKKKKNVESVMSCAMFLREVLRGRGKIVQGYCSTATGEKFRHYWVEDDDQQHPNTYDISMEMAKLAAPEIMGLLAYTLSKENTDEKEFVKDDHNDELFTLYLEEPKKFWKGVERLR